LKRVTSQDVAKQAGVSRTTVSLVLNKVQGAQISEETRQRVLEVAQELGYVPDAAAQALASRRAQIIGLVLTRSAHHIASDIFLTQILDGLMDVVHAHDMRLLLDILEPPHQKQAYMDLVRAKRIDGIILSGPRFHDDGLQMLEEHGFPTILMGHMPEAGCCSVDVDNYSAAHRAVSYLIEHGHQTIACITNADLTYTASSERLNGYRAALEEAGLPFDEDLVRYGDFTPESGYQHMQSLVRTHHRRGHPFSAAFVASDVVAIGAKAALRAELLAVPQDVSLVGFDDIPFARYMDPPLTTIRLPAYQLGFTAGQHLIHLIQRDEPVVPRALLPTELVVRESCCSHIPP
jgi:LacI family transcriptional regulator